jgi:hypothetical protein
MKKKVSVWIAVALAAVTYFCGYSGGRDVAYSSGYDAGQKSGYADGVADTEEARAEFQYTEEDTLSCYDDGYQDGLADGAESSYDTGYAEGYEAGHSAGVLEGKASAKTTSGSSAPTVSNSSGSAGNSSNNRQETTVYVTKTGSKYHRSGCQYLRQSQIAISLSSAKAQGYTACSKCW